MNPYADIPNARKIMSVIAVYIAVAFSIMISSGGSTMLPVAAREIGGMDIYTLALTVPGVIGIALMPLFGYLSAKNPAIKRPIFVVAFLLAAVGIFLRGIAPNMWWIVIPSVILGMYSPSIYVLGYSLIRDMYEQKQAGTYLGVVGTMQSVGLLVGPLLTGFLITSFSWRIVNFIIAPFFLLSAVFMYLGPKILKDEAESISTTTAKLDSQGAVATIVFLTSLIMFLSLSRYAPFGSSASNILLCIAIVALICLVLIIRKKGTAAFIPVPVLKDRNTLCLTAINFFRTVSSMAVSIFLPVYVMYVMKLPASTSGIVMALYAVAGLFMGPIVGRMIGKAGNARAVLVWGSGALRAAIQVVLVLVISPTMNIYILYIIMFIAGFYSVFGGVAGAVAPQIQLKPDVRQQGNAIIQLGQNFGGAVGVAVFTAINAVIGSPAKSFPVILIVAAITAFIAMLAGIPLKKIEAHAAGSSRG